MFLKLQVSFIQYIMPICDYLSRIILLLLRQAISEKVIINLYTVLRQVHRIFQSKISTECKLVFPLLISSTLSLPCGHPVTAYVFFIVGAVTSNLSSMCFRSQFLRKMWPIHLAFFLVIVCMLFLSSLTLCNTSFSHDLSNWSSSFSSTAFQDFPGIYDLLSEVSQVAAERSRNKINLNVK